MSDIKEAKIKLYSLLLKKHPTELTDNEVDIGFYLSKDNDIQEVLDTTLTPND